MFAHWPIKKKLTVATAILAVILLCLAISGIRGAYAYRAVVKGISNRAIELPLTTDMYQIASTMDASVRQVSSSMESPAQDASFPANDDMFSNMNLQELQQTLEFGISMIDPKLKAYRAGLERSRSDITVASGLGLQRDESDKLRDIDKSMAKLKGFLEPNAIEDQFDLMEVHDTLFVLVGEFKELSLFLQTRMENLALSVRNDYRFRILLSWLCIIAVVSLLTGLGWFLYHSLFQPFRKLLNGSRRVACGDFDHRIEIESHDEMQELATAMNQMTERFQEIHDALDAQVKQKTREIVRSEQLASVGFLAAGVSHEINNPLQSIALCAESLEERLHDIIQADDELPDEAHNAEITVVRQYLRMIQDEAFRCKQITGQLLDFARLGESDRTAADLTALTHEVVEMVGHLGKYQQKRIAFESQEPVIADMNAQEMKQVLLNLITNGLDSIDQGGSVTVQVDQTDGQAVLRVADNGCGMSDEVKQHLFEPFYTRRRDGKGTGLGLSISYAIIQEHGGDIVPTSEGPGKGSQFIVTIPLVAERNKKESHHQRQAA